MIELRKRLSEFRNDRKARWHMKIYDTDNQPSSFEEIDAEEKKLDASKAKNKEKKGFFERGNPLTDALMTIGSLILVNIYFIICSLPIVTIGASLAALNRVCYDIMDIQDIRVTKTFFKTFASSFVQGTIVWIILCGFTSAAGFGIYMMFTQPGDDIVRTIVIIVCAMVIIPCLMIFSYYFMIIGRYKNEILAQIRNAFLMAMVKLGWTLVIWILWGAVIALFVFVPDLFTYGGWLILLFGFSGLAYITCHIYKRVFRTMVREDAE